MAERGHRLVVMLPNRQARISRNSTTRLKKRPPTISPRIFASETRALTCEIEVKRVEMVVMAVLQVASPSSQHSCGRPRLHEPAGSDATQDHEWH
jgi:hypothetical protein